MDPEKTDVILGPPGTGKTTFLIGMPPKMEGPTGVVERALLDGINPREIGFISFTKKATEEGRSRAATKFGIPENEFEYFRTIHSMAFRHLGMHRDQVLGWQHLKELGNMLGLEFKGRGEVLDGDVYGMNEADRMLFLEGLARNRKVPLKSVWNEDAIDWFELERFSKALHSFKKSRMLFDYTDILERFVSIDPKSLPSFKILIIDEGQDLSQLLWDAVELLSLQSERVYIAGDDEQAIYKWSGADVDKFLALNGNIRTLNVSYRVPRAVHKLAESLSSRISKRFKKIWTPRNETGAINWYNNIDEVDMSQGTWLLLARNGYMLRDLEDHCLSQGYSFTSVSRNPLKSNALQAIRIWESLRRGKDEAAEDIVDCLKYMHPSLVELSLLKKLKSEPTRLYGIPELRANGLKTEDIWHKVLTKISPTERDYFIAVRRRGEPLLKEPRIRISTIHAAKGGQADHVLLLTDISYRCHNNMQESYDDEVRVWYVAATRCKKTLNVILPHTNLNFEL